jgi:hypothetical protein
MAVAETKTTAQAEQGGGLSRFLPIVQWLPRYDRSWLKGDLIAALSVWALRMPSPLRVKNLLRNKLRTNQNNLTC